MMQQSCGFRTPRLRPRLRGHSRSGIGDVRMNAAPRPAPRALEARRRAHGVTATLSLALLAFVAGCDQPRAHGDVHAVVVAATADLWQQVEMDVENAIAPTIQVVRNERTFRVTWQDPSVEAEWSPLRRFRNIVVIGAEGDPWVDEVLASRRGDAPAVQAPQIVKTQNVWARGQGVTLVLLPSSGDAEALAGLLEPLNRSLDDQYREFARNRMFVSGRDTILADSLSNHVGFRLVLPAVYRYSVTDSVFRFRNDNPSPTELIREIGVTWASPIPDELPGQAEIEMWRRSFAEANYGEPQVLDTTVTTLREVAVAGSDRPGLEYQAAWASAPDAWPAGGPLLTRVLPCPGQDRLYFLDAWLYAPAREKYEYLIQLQTILDSFQCAGGPPVATASRSGAP
ncbi:MAG: DUF4837 family protein [Gemmatimonadales bacterium]|nr:MAG: DUF4837 family protein [Gemmatimonadales bacterium]